MILSYTLLLFIRYYHIEEATTMLIAIDSGKYATKAKNQSAKLSFRTKLLKLINTNNSDISGSSYLVSFNNHAYIVGDQGEEQSYDLSKTSIIHQLAAYTAITQLLTPSSKVVQLTIGCPLSIYKNKSLREDYRDFILGARHIHITVNDISYHFYLDNALVLPETSGVVYTNPQLFKNKRVAVIDLGGLNLNFCIYDNYVPQISIMFTSNNGGISLHNLLLKELNTMYGLSLQLNDIPHIIRHGCLKLNGTIEPSSYAVIKNSIATYLSSVIQEIKHNGFSLDTLEFVFIGGTSELISQYISDTIPHANIVGDASFANVSGFYKIGVIKYAEADHNKLHQSR